MTKLNFHDELCKSNLNSNSNEIKRMIKSFSQRTNNERRILLRSDAKNKRK